ncbi:unnamed protein product [Orchesella dallaii]|uniref:Thioredoxin domain-containing protein n=1 Tax=Orchesella dallaii TaxID=48710 RepID=A0ABP1R3C5_9HEXA
MVFRTLAVLSVLLCVQLCLSQNRQNILDVYRKEVFQYGVMRNQRPVIAYFTKSTCVPCRNVRNRLEDFARKNSNVMDVAIIDVEKLPELKEELGVRIIPTTRAYYKGNVEGEIKGPSWNGIEKLANELING